MSASNTNTKFKPRQKTKPSKQGARRNPSKRADFQVETVRGYVLVTPLSNIAYDWAVANLRETVRWGRSYMFRPGTKEKEVRSRLSREKFAVIA